jgi:hypothetical protein
MTSATPDRSKLDLQRAPQPPASANGWRTLAHQGPGLPTDWHARLCTRLGQRPRRIGAWAEMALYGARACLDAAGEGRLPDGALLWVASLRGPVQATRAGIEQLGSGGTLPFTFLQSQPSQMLAALCQHLRWDGDARFVLSRDALSLRRLAQLEVGPPGLLLGWVDEGTDGDPALGRSEWWRLRPDAAAATS